MTFRLSAAVRNAMLDAFESTIGTSMVVKLRTGAAPADVATADSGTVLSTINCPSDYMAAASSGSKAKSGTWEDTSADASGLARHFRCYASNGTTAHAQGLVSMPYAASTAVVVGQQMHNGSNVYVCTTAGTTGASSAPTGTGTGITDGGAVWDYAGPVSMTVDNVNIASGQTVTITGFTLTAPNA